MKVVDIADEIYRGLGSPTTLSLPAISFWVRTNIGELNNRINTTYSIDSTTLELEDADSCEIGEEEVAIIKKMYLIHYYDGEVRSALGAGSYDHVILAKDKWTSIRKVNRNEIAKTLSSVKKEEMEELNKLVNAYKLSKSNPIQVAGDDTEEGTYPGTSSGSVVSSYRLRKI